MKNPKTPEPWPKVWTLSKSLTCSFCETGALVLSNCVLTKAEVRRLFVRLKSLYRD